MTLERLDLNLLRIFDAIYRERSVTRAARALGMEQPSVSNALGRLRVAVGDDLFLRTAEGMEPTPRADSLAAAVIPALVGLRQAFGDVPRFDPAAARGTLTLGMTPEAEWVLGASLATRLAAEAPGLRLRIVPLDAQDLPDALAAEPMPVAIALLGEDPAPPVTALPLWSESGAVLLRRGHPVLGGAWDAALYLGLTHLRLSLPSPLDGLVEGAAGSAGRRIGRLVGSPLAAAQAVAGSDLAWTLPERAAAAVAALAGLELRPLPLPVPPLITRLCWHRRMDGDGCSLWLRRLVVALARPLTITPSAG